MVGAGRGGGGGYLKKKKTLNFYKLQIDLGSVFRCNEDRHGELSYVLTQWGFSFIKDKSGYLGTTHIFTPGKIPCDNEGREWRDMRKMVPSMADRKSVV